MKELHASKPTVRPFQKTALLLVFAFLCGTAAQAQNYMLEYESSTHHLVKQNPDGIKNYWQRQYSGRLDMNADGVNDLVTIHEDPQGTPVEIVVFDMVAREQIWNWADDNGVPAEFMGFADIDGDGGLREPVFIFGGEGMDTLMIINPDSKTAELGIIGILVALIEDIDNDGLLELIINTVDGGTEVWGKGAAGRSSR